jgi:hypothetical protein
MFLPITLIYDTRTFDLQTDLLELKRNPIILRPSFDPYPWSTSKDRSDRCLKNPSFKKSKKCRSEYMRLSLVTLMLLKYNHVMYLANRHLICLGSIPVGEFAACTYRLSPLPMHHFHLPPPPFHVVFPPSPSLFCPILSECRRFALQCL